jgi:hypothetical protein
MGVNRIAINQSRIKAWRTCKRQHWYKYQERLKRKKIKRPFMFGNIVHEMLEAHANGQDAFRVLTKIERENRKLFRAEKEVYGDIVRDVEYIMTEYFDYWENHPKKEDLAYIRINGKVAEHVFEIEIEKGVVWKGKIDSFAKNNNLTWLVEHKTFAKEWSEDERWRNLQSVTYIRAAREMGWPDPEGTCWDYILSKAPTMPKLKQDGTPSAAAIVTLPSVVHDFMREHNLNRKQCDALMESSRANYPKYFQRIFTPVNRDIEENIFSDFEEDFRDIVEQHDKKKSRNIGRHCGWCDFEPLCRAELQGLDVDYIRSHEYAIETDDPAERVEGSE